jgi:hypothetical protein
MKRPAVLSAGQATTSNAKTAGIALAKTGYPPRAACMALALTLPARTLSPKIRDMHMWNICRHAVLERKVAALSA